MQETRQATSEGREILQARESAESQTMNYHPEPIQEDLKKIFRGCLPKLFLFILAAYIAVVIGFKVYANGKCLSGFYPRSYVTWDFDIYCERLIQDVEFICPVDYIIPNGCTWGPKGALDGYKVDNY